MRDGEVDTGPGDGGVAARLRRRTVGAGVASGSAGVLIAVTAFQWPGWAVPPDGSGAVGSVIAVVVAVLLVSAGYLVRRARVWASVAASGPGPTFAATVGAPADLHRTAGLGPVRRRVRAQVVPVSTRLGPFAGGSALLVHGRQDGLRMSAGDRVSVRPLGRRGPYLLTRLSDDAVFVGQRGWLSAW